MGFKNVTGKLGTMRKSVSWVLYPQNADTPNIVVIQSEKRIAKVDVLTSTAVLSDGKGGHQGFYKLSPQTGAVVVDVPPDMIAVIKAHIATNTVGDGIGAAVVLGIKS